MSIMRKNLNRTIFCFVFAVLFVCFKIASADQKPERIASTHLCTDQLLLLIADPDRIASLSIFASNPNMSMMAESAQPYPVNHGLAEELVVLNPDLILTSQFGSPNVLLLQRLGYRILNIPVALTIDNIRSNILVIADAIGERDRAENLIREFNRRIELQRVPEHEPHPMIVMYQPNGYTFGDQTLRSQIIEYAGFKNLAIELGMSHTRHLPLEVLITSRLDALMVETDYDHAALAHELPNHPAIQTAFADVPRVDVPGKMWICGTPFITDALEHLVKFRSQIIVEQQ